MSGKTKELIPSVGYVPPSRERSRAYQRGWRMHFEGIWVNPHLECDDDYQEWEDGWEDAADFTTQNLPVFTPKQD